MCIARNYPSVLFYSSSALIVGLTPWHAEDPVMCSTAGLRKCSGRRPAGRLRVLCLAWVPAGLHQLLEALQRGAPPAAPRLTSIQQCSRRLPCQHPLGTELFFCKTFVYHSSKKQRGEPFSMKICSAQQHGEIHLVSNPCYMNSKYPASERI